MKNLITLFVFAFYCYTNKAQTLLPKNDPAFKLVFEENFNEDTINRAKWMKQYPWGHFFNGNKFPAAWSSCATCCTNLAAPFDDVSGIRMNYSDTNTLKITSGVCELKIKKQNAYGHIYSWPGGVFTPDSIPYKYIKSMLVSRNSFKYGYFEIRFKYSYRSVDSDYNSYTPTFWLLGDNSDTSAIMKYSETDIFEINAVNNGYASTMHHRTNYQPNRIDEQVVWDKTIVTGGTWHTGAAYWHPHGINFYVDDVLKGQWVTDTAALMEKQYMIIDVDSPAMNFCTPIDSVNTQYPYSMWVDHVKVWQLNAACDTSKTVCNATLATHPLPKVYQQFTEGGTSCNVQLNNGTTGIFGKNYVLLNEGFEVGNNADILMDVKDCYDSYINKPFPFQRLNPSNIPQLQPSNFLKDYNPH